MKFKQIYLVVCLPLLLFSCKGADKPAGAEDAAVVSQTPVTVTTVNDSSLVDYFDVSATSVFQQKNIVKANANGYIQGVTTQLGHYVGKGSTVFTIKTKEAQSIGNSINILDTTFKFSGVNRIKAPGNGYITQLNHQQGDYVQDGEQLAIISDRASFAFIMQIPYEMRRYVKISQGIQLILPGGEKIDGTVASAMPSVDTLSQTQGMVIRVNSTNLIPENLVAKARIVKSLRSNAASLPKAAILTNETQTEFWVMKLINPTTAVKTTVTKGIESGDRVEILSPKFSEKDQIVVTGNYGLTDTAKVKIVQ
ncbi:efflux RND transporter periplasmic adaptor subunit [Mucilaginibacter sp. FT3.2]|uniref:efflux RND transporter periplasmic adaptor subunit n=1 Tax=Mucilaginibacter sp. FT3.2 TaxID=2723090 RepID=UPI0016191841|nr:HlyD family efflux transporter periplasmic adaptor subunit [Mucilaginibacter sp. FT3.2]MBB6229706.1 multidrug efflux pump subunit AcrA (membrane-fusion protein) [Mucilaginibacter sp. FT3.2]